MWKTGDSSEYSDSDLQRRSLRAEPACAIKSCRGMWLCILGYGESWHHLCRHGDALHVFDFTLPVITTAMLQGWTVSWPPQRSNKGSASTSIPPLHGDACLTFSHHWAGPGVTLRLEGPIRFDPVQEPLSKKFNPYSLWRLQSCWLTLHLDRRAGREFPSGGCKKVYCMKIKKIHTVSIPVRTDRTVALTGRFSQVENPAANQDSSFLSSNY